LVNSADQFKDRFSIAGERARPWLDLRG
jgi:hypothetical protein